VYEKVDFQITERGLQMVKKERCPKCGQLVIETAINRERGNCYFCSGVSTTTNSPTGEEVVRKRGPSG
jgi:hypothetical protein